jgi:hypothetical protein
MRGFLSSPRRRRRTLWTGALLIIAGGITFSLIHWSNTSHYRELQPRPGTPQVVRPPERVSFREARHEGVLKIAAQFVNTAVKRTHIEKSFDLATPALRTGYTRASWAKGDIPVQPYPVETVKYDVKASFADEVWLQVAVFPDKKHKSIVPTTFDLVLKPFGQGKARHWLVDSWAHTGYLSVPAAPEGAKTPAVVEYKSPVSGWWVFLPVSAFGLGLVLLASVAVRGWWRNARAVKRYKSTYL